MISLPITEAASTKPWALLSVPDADDFTTTRWARKEDSLKAATASGYEDR